MATLHLPVIVHGVTGRMGQTALRALAEIGKNQMARVDGDLILPVPIGVARNAAKLREVAHRAGLEHWTTSLERAVELARAVNPELMVYHNTVPTGARKETMLAALDLLDPEQAAVFMEKPVAANYADGYEIVTALESRGFTHGVVHHMLRTPGVLAARELLPKIKPYSVVMSFGYEVGSGFGPNPEYRAQRPDFNWRLETAGGGIILDMCHEGYLSKALFGATERLSCVARLYVPRRLAADGATVIECNVEDYAAIRREHVSGVVNTSVWTWCRRVNSEFGPFEITVDGENGSIVFGLDGLKVQWKETAPAMRWERTIRGEVIRWRDHWEYPELEKRNPFAEELAEFLCAFVGGEEYELDAVHALNLLGEVEALYESAARDGEPIPPISALSPGTTPWLAA